MNPFANIAAKTLLRYAIGAGAVVLLGGIGYGVVAVKRWDHNRFVVALDAQRDSIATANAKIVHELTPRIEHDTVQVVKWRTKIIEAQDTTRAASVRVDTAIVRLSEGARSDTTVRALVTAVRALQADTARLFAAMVTERRAVDSLRVDYDSGLKALGNRVVFVTDSMQRKVDAQARTIHRMKIITVLTDIGSAALGVAGTYLAMRKP